MTPAEFVAKGGTARGFTGSGLTPIRHGHGIGIIERRHRIKPHGAFVVELRDSD